MWLQCNWLLFIIRGDGDHVYHWHVNKKSALAEWREYKESETIDRVELLRVKVVKVLRKDA